MAKALKNHLLKKKCPICKKDWVTQTPHHVECSREGCKFEYRFENYSRRDFYNNDAFIFQKCHANTSFTYNAKQLGSYLHFSSGAINENLTFKNSIEMNDPFLEELVSIIQNSISMIEFESFLIKNSKKFSERKRNRIIKSDNQDQSVSINWTWKDLSKSPEVIISIWDVSTHVTTTINCPDDTQLNVKLDWIKEKIETHKFYS